MEPRLRGLVALATLPALVSGCLAGPGAGEEAEGAGDLAAQDRWQRLYVFDGEIRDPTQVRSYPFQVPAGAEEAEALLTWSMAGALLGFRLLGPDGQEAAAGWNEGDGRAYVTTTHPVVAGDWVLEVMGDRAALTRFAATVTVHGQAVPEGPIAATFVIPARNPTRDLPPEVRAGIPAAGPRDYAEVNLNMAPGDWFRFSWNASAPVYFNVHYHGADGTTQRPIEERTEASAGSFAADATEVYALLWRNESDRDVEVTVEMDGAYRLHSMTRGR